MNIKSLQSKITAYPWLKPRNMLGLCLLMATVFIVAYSYVTAKEMVGFAVNSATNAATDVAEVIRKKALDAATEQLVTRARAKAFQVQAELDEAMGVAATLAEVFSGMKTAGVAVDVGRDSVNSMLKTILENNKTFVAAYTCWEPDAFDMLDLAFAGAREHDKTGRFIPYWYRTDNSKIGHIPSQDYENTETYPSGVRKGEYYLGPRESGTPQIINPYPRVIGDKEVWITSVVVPIKSDGAFVGIAGIDLSLDFLQRLAQEVAGTLFMGKGKVMFISHNGTLAATSGSPDNIGRHIKNLLANWEKNMKYITSGEEVSEIDKGEVSVFTPLTLEETDTPWSVHIVVPENVIQADAKAIHEKMMSDAVSIGESLTSESSKAIGKQMGVGLVLATASVLIIILIRALEKKDEKRTLQLAETNNELRETLDDLKKTQGQLIESEKMAALGGLVAGVAHEINTPVGVSVTDASFLEAETKRFSELQTSGKMKRSDFEQYIKDALGASSNILRNLMWAAELIKSFKQVAVDQSSEEQRRFGLKAYISEILLSLRPKYKRTEHTITVNCPEDLEIESYPGAFSHIVTNLVTNSLIHGFEGIEKGEIVFNVSAHENELLFSYKDNGKGMDDESIRQIFDPFFTTKRGQGGTGLGMHIVYNLVAHTLGGQL